MALFGGVGSLSGVGDIVAFVKLSGATEFNRDMDQMNAKTQAAGKMMDKALTASVIAGTAALVGAVAAASKFESSFTGVTKTVDGLRNEMGGLNAEGEALAKGFRQLALEVPISVNELNKIGELGGQLGIAKEDLLSFTKTIAMLGDTTNLSIEEAATATARFVNVTQQVAPAGMSAADQIEHIGSVLVGLGNNFATTESDILMFSSRLAGAGNIIGLSQDEILAFSATLSSLGINAQAGGTAMSKVFIDMANAVAQGGSQLDLFAKTAKMDVGEFQQLFEKDASQAIVKFVEGLGDVEKSGGNVFKTIEDLGFANERTRQSLLKLASGSGLLTKALDLGATEWIKNNALSKEAEQRYKTFESQLKLLKGAFNEAFIIIGSEVLPVLKDMVETLTEHPTAIANITRTLFLLIVPLGILVGIWKTYNAVSTAWIGLGLAKKFTVYRDSLIKTTSAQGLATKSINLQAIELGVLSLAIAATGQQLVNLYFAYTDWRKSLGLIDEALENNAKITTIAGDKVTSLQEAMIELKMHKGDELVVMNGRLITVSKALDELNVIFGDVLNISDEYAATITLAWGETGKLALRTAELKALEEAQLKIKEKLAEAGIETTASIKAQITELGKLVPLVESDNIASKNLGNSIADLREKIMPATVEIAGMRKEFTGLDENLTEANMLMNYNAQLTGALYDESYKLNNGTRESTISIGELVKGMNLLGLELVDVNDDTKAFLTTIASFASEDYITGAIGALKILDGWVNQVSVSIFGQVKTIEELQAAHESNVATLEASAQAHEDWTASLNNSSVIGAVVVSGLTGLFGGISNLVDVTVEATAAQRELQEEQRREVEYLQVIADSHMYKYQPALLASSGNMEEWRLSQRRTIEEIMAANPAIDEQTVAINNQNTAVSKLANSLGYVTQEYVSTSSAVSTATDEITSFSVAWDTLQGKTIGGFDQIEKDAKTVTDALEKMSFFGIDFETSDADEQIGNAIARMKEFMGALDPNSAAFAEAQTIVSGLVSEFEAMGGVIPDVATEIQGIITGTTGGTSGYYIDVVKTWSEAADEIAAKFGENGDFFLAIRDAKTLVEDMLILGVDIDTTDADEKIGALIIQLRSFLRTITPDDYRYNKAVEYMGELLGMYVALGAPVTIDLVIGTEAASRLDYYLAALDRVSSIQYPGSYHTGGMITAHSGTELGNYGGKKQVPFLGLEGEQVIGPKVSDMYSSQQFSAFNQTGDPSAFGGGGGNVTVQVKEPGPLTSVEYFRNDTDRLLKEQSRYKITSKYYGVN